MSLITRPALLNQRTDRSKVRWGLCGWGAPSAAGHVMTLACCHQNVTFDQQSVSQSANQPAFLFAPPCPLSPALSPRHPLSPFPVPPIAIPFAVFFIFITIFAARCPALQSVGVVVWQAREARVSGVVWWAKGRYVLGHRRRRAVPRRV